MHRFFVSENSICKDQVAFSKDQAHQMRNVLRLKPGQTVVALDNAGVEYEVELTLLDRDDAAGSITATRQAAGEPRLHITLFQAMLAREKFELVLQKCTEVGVARFVPVITERTLVRNTAIKDSKMTRWRQIITEAAEQSKRGRVPQLDCPITLADALEGVAESGLGLVAYENEHDISLRRALRDHPGAPDAVALLIGPEGGLSGQEVELTRRRGWKTVGLGPRILRTETAAIVAASAILYEFEQIG